MKLRIGVIREIELSEEECSSEKFKSGVTNGIIYRILKIQSSLPVGHCILGEAASSGKILEITHLQSAEKALERAERKIRETLKTKS